MNDIKKGTQKSAPIGNLSYVDRRLRTHEKRKAQLEGRYDEALDNATSTDTSKVAALRCIDNVLQSHPSFNATDSQKSPRQTKALPLRKAATAKSGPPPIDAAIEIPPPTNGQMYMPSEVAVICSTLSPRQRRPVLCSFIEQRLIPRRISEWDVVPDTMVAVNYITRNQMFYFLLDSLFSVARS
jgi:hypothetical protein